MGEVTGRRTAVLVDPHPLWLDAVEDVVAKVDFDVVGKTTSLRQAAALVRERQPSLVVAEVFNDDGDVDGSPWLEAIAQIVPQPKIVVLSLCEDPEAIDGALSSGATAYVIKTAHPDDLASAIRQAFDHSIYLRSSGVRQMSGRSRETAGESAGLTRRELEILRLVSEGLSNAQLARMLWVTEQTVKFHLSNVYRKLGVGNRTEASRWAQLNGLLPAETSSATRVA
jgi:DNA-binding NarL/FixJ family response regulator